MVQEGGAILLRSSGGRPAEIRDALLREERRRESWISLAESHQWHQVKEKRASGWRMVQQTCGHPDGKTGGRIGSPGVDPSIKRGGFKRGSFTRSGWADLPGDAPVRVPPEEQLRLLLQDRGRLLRQSG